MAEGINIVDAIYEVASQAGVYNEPFNCFDCQKH